MGGCHLEGDRVWKLFQLAVKKSTMQVDNFSPFLYKRVFKMLLSPRRGSTSGTAGSFQSKGTYSGQKAVSIECSLMSGCGQVMNLQRTSE